MREGGIQVRLGVFFSGVITGCSCADDLTPIKPQDEYGELHLVIDRIRRRRG